MTEYRYPRQKASNIRQAAEAARKLSGAQLQAVRNKIAHSISTKASSKLREEQRRGNVGDLRGALHQYAKGGGLASSLLSKFGRLGKAIEYVVGGLRQSGVTEDAVRDAIELLRQVAPEALSPEFRGQPKKLRPIPVAPKEQEPPEGVTPPVTPAVGGPPAGRHVRDLAITMIPVSGSSNVYAYGYDPVQQVLRVQFLAAAVHGHSVRKTTAGNVGRLGSTVSNVRGGPGPVYDYFDVPPSVFNRMVAASSKGKAVWDLLRVRGTIEGHQYRYTLAAAGQAQILGGSGSLTYVPRRAVSGGFRARRTGYGVRSLLPSEFGPRSFGPAPTGAPSDGRRP